MTFDAVTCAVRDALLELPGVQGIFLSGSKGEGLADDVSDTDLVLVVGADDVDAASTSLETLEVPTLGAIVHRDVLRSPAATVFNHISERYDRFDVALESPTQFARRSSVGIVAVHDPSDLMATLSSTVDAPQVNFVRMLHMSTECLRVLGLLKVGIAREDWVVMCGGAGMLRTMVSNMLLDLKADGPRGGMMSFRRALPPETYRALAELPPIVAERDAIIAIHEALAKLLLTAIKPAVVAAGQAWPHAFEETVRRSLAASGVKI